MRVKDKTTVNPGKKQDTPRQPLLICRPCLGPTASLHAIGQKIPKGHHWEMLLIFQMLLVHCQNPPQCSLTLTSLWSSSGISCVINTLDINNSGIIVEVSNNRSQAEWYLCQGQRDLDLDPFSPALFRLDLPPSLPLPEVLFLVWVFK